MKKVLIMMMCSVFSWNIWAQVDCYAVKDAELIEVKIIDTFLERTAFINRIHPRLTFPVVDMGVFYLEKGGMVAFFNEKYDFSLTLNRILDVPQTPFYQGYLKYQNLTSDMECIIQ